MKQKDFKTILNNSFTSCKISFEVSVCEKLLQLYFGTCKRSTLMTNNFASTIAATGSKKRFP